VNTAPVLVACFSLLTMLILLQELVLQETWLFQGAVAKNIVSCCCSSMSVQYYQLNKHFILYMQQFPVFEKRDLAVMRQSTLKTQDKVVLIMNLTTHMHFVHIV